MAVDYRWNDSLMTYAQAATGFKGGGVNPRPYFPSQALPFQPEEVMSYEIGIKSDFLDRRARVNVAAFYSDFKNMHVILGECDSVSFLAPGVPWTAVFPGTHAPCSQTTNGGDSKLWGVEVEAFFEPIDGLQIDATASLIDFEYKSVNPVSGISLDDDLPFLVKNKFAIGLQYELAAFGGTLTPRVDFDYRSGFETEAVNSPDPLAGRVDSRSIVNARITYEPEGSDWEFAAAVTNLFDNFYYANKFDRSAPPFFASHGLIGRPLEWNLSVKRNF